jgi:hypothetical protein
MGLCNDKSVKYLRGLGYNVVRHPNASLRPLDLIGVQNGASNYLGPLNLLITNPPGPAPAIKADVPAASINGQQSSKINIGVGVDILGSLIGAMGGGNLGAELSYTNARKIQFEYSGVVNDEAMPLEIGNYLRSGMVDAQNLILKQYVLGDGDLYVVTKTAKSKKFSVSFENSNGTAASVKVPVLQGVAGGSLSVSVDAQRSHVVNFEGQTPLVFGFQCFQVGVEDGELSLMSTAPGGVPLAVGSTGSGQPVILSGNGMLGLRLP